MYGLSKLVKPSWGEDTWILDVGGNLGITAIHLHLRAKKSKLLTLEPSPWNYILLRLNLLQQPGHADCNRLLESSVMLSLSIVIVVQSV